MDHEKRFSPSLSVKWVREEWAEVRLERKSYMIRQAYALIIFTRTLDTTCTLLAAHLSNEIEFSTDFYRRTLDMMNSSHS